MFHEIDTATAVLERSDTKEGYIGGEARIAEPPASGPRMFQDIDTAKAVWSEAT
jgi:hypothetical protein